MKDIQSAGKGKALFLLMRPSQWVKNILLFLPVFFAQEMGDPDRLQHVAILFAGFCMLTSGVYVFNDLMDAAEDRLHPVKQFRPIACRRVTRAEAILFMLSLYGLSALFLGYILPKESALPFWQNPITLLATGYTIDYLNVILSFLSAIIAVIYILYTHSPEVTERSSEHLYVTIPFVLAGIMRYLQIILVEKSSCNPTDILLQDRTLQLTVAGWFIVFALLIY